VLYTAVKWLLFATVVILVGRVLLTQIRTIAWDQVQVAVPFAVLAGLGTVASKAVAFMPYGWLMSRFCSRPRWPGVIASVWTAQLGRYVPGKIGTVAGIVLLFRRHNVPGQAAIGAVFVADGLAAILGAIIAVPLVLWEPVRRHVPYAWLWCLVLTTVGVTCLHPRVFKAVANAVLRRLGRQEIQALPRIRDYALPALALAAQYVLYGVAYWCMARALAGVPTSAIPVFIAIATTGVLAGLIAFFAPAGLGVQEGTFLLTLTQVMPKPEAALLIVVMRLVLTLAEVTLAGVGLLVLRHTAVRPNRTES